MKTIYVILIAITFFCAQSLPAQGNPEFSKLSKEGFEAAKNKDWDKAVEAYRRATQIDRKASQNFSAALRQRAFVYQSQQKYQQAAADYDEALKITHNDPELYFAHAGVLVKLNNMDKALSDCSEAIKLRGDETKYYLLRSYIYEMKNDVAHSMADTKKVLQAEPENAEALGRKMRLEARQAQNAPPTPPAPAPKKP